MNLNRTPNIKFLLSHPSHFLSLGFGAGLSPYAPGTVGTVAAVPIYLLMVHFLSWMGYAIVVLGIFLIGIWICGVTGKALGEDDHGSIVWDEIAGYLITMFLLPQAWWTVLAGFIAFRVFDIWKPYPISWLDRELKGGVGTMVDDVVAGIFAWVFIQVAIYSTAHLF